jgi:SagB-type dehydrogenase family enzyme
MLWLSMTERWQAAGLAMQLRLRPEVTVEQVDQDLVVHHWWGAVRLAGLPPAHRGSVHRLVDDWQDLRELTSPGATVADAATLAQMLWICEQLAFLLQLRVVAGDTPLLTVQPTSRAASLPDDTPAPAVLALSPYTFLHVVDGELVLESAASDHRVILNDPHTWQQVIETGCGRRSGGTETDGLIVGILAGIGMLTSKAPGANSPLAQATEFHDLLMHQRSRLGTFDTPFGAEFPYLGIAEPPAPFPDSGADAIALPIPAAAVVRSRDPSLIEVMENRCSLREYSEEPLTLAQVGEFLFRCARARGEYGPNPEDGLPYVAVDKPMPSGGGMHELELYLVAGNVEDLASGVYHYLAHRHALERIQASAAEAEAVLAAAQYAAAAAKPPPLLIKITSRFARLAWKYRAIGYATTLKNVGVIYQTMYLVATAMGLAPCALGSGDEVAGRLALGPAAAGQLGVGEFMLGRPASPTQCEETLLLRRSHPGWRGLVAPDWGRISTTAD